MKRSLAVADAFLGVGGTLLVTLVFFAFAAGRDSEGGPALADRRDVVAPTPGAGTLIERLQRTNLLNGGEIHDRLGLAGGSRPPGFLTHSPFGPRFRGTYLNPVASRFPLPANPQSHQLDEAGSTFLFYGQEPILRWYRSLGSNTEVCAVGFDGLARADYRLRTFPDRESALGEGYVITHRHHCGTCSSLRDLAVYIAKPDLTSPTRSCARRLTAGGVKACLMDEVGFEERCAETWTYNVLHTRRQCAAACIAHYGLWNVLTDRMGDAHADKSGNLNPCLACDEHTSGPGFQYAAGRTRRTSGLMSAINRPAVENHPVDHGLYFE